MLKKLLAVMCFATFFACFAGKTLTPIPFKQDPPIQIDGDLSDWNDVPVVYLMNSKEQMAWEDKMEPVWKGPEDLSGRVMFCWKPGGLYMAADITDDFISQKHGGSKLFYGDHLELFLDTTPFLTGNNTFGRGQFHIGISPGNFEGIQPEIFCFHPKNLLLKDVVFASVRTEKGWMMEMYLPWTSLGMPASVLEGTPINFELWLSDTDAENDSKQKRIMTTGALNWEFRNRKTMKRAILADANGKINHDPYKNLAPVKMYDKVTVLKKSFQKKIQNLPAAPAGAAQVLSFQARLNSSRLNGYASALKIVVNGKNITGEKLYNRPLIVETKKGVAFSFYDIKSGSYFVPYTGPDDFYSGNQKGTWLQWFKQHVNMHDFEFDITFALKNGENVIEFFNTHQSNDMSLRNVQLSLKEPKVVRKRRGAPTGAIPVIHPQTKHKIDYAVLSQGNPLSIRLGTKTWDVKSAFSTPDGKWVSGSNPYFSHRRIVEKKAEAIIVNDVFTNLTNEPLPLMQRHEIFIPGEDRKFYINGLEAIPSNEKSQSFNASSYGASKEGGIGMFPLNKVFQIHAENYIAGNDSIGLCDQNFVLPPKGSATQSFVVIPTKSGDYWNFINPLRRLVGANFRVDGPMGTFMSVNNTLWWTDKKLISRAKTRNVEIFLVDTGLVLPHGSTYSESKEKIAFMKNTLKRLRRLFPGKKLLLYLHTQIEKSKNADQLFPGARVMNKNGSPAFYGSPDGKLFFCVDGNSYSRMIEKKIQDYLSWDIDGFFWDEMAASGVKYHYGDPWDGCSGDISLKTHKLERLKSSVILLQMPWHVKMIKRFKQQNKTVFVNGRTYGELQNFKLPVLVETAQIANCARTNVWSPIQCGDYTNHRKNQLEFYKAMVAGLDYGCIFMDWPLAPPYNVSGYPDNTEDYHTLTDHLFPFTPLELHKGYVIGKERIVTKESGLFGWNDVSEHKVHVYDETGHEKKDFKTVQKKINGRNYSELRLPEDWSAVIIRKEK